MPKAPQIPLHLCQVLEEEFINLHRQLDQKPTWDFESGQFKSLAELARRLREAASGPPVDKISNHIRSWLPKELLAIIDAGGGPDGASLSAAFNKILPEKGFYSERVFAGARLPESTRQLIELGTKDGPLSFTGDDLKRFNRLLIEGAYAEEVSGIYEVRLENIFALIHSVKPAALCLSGGGIRSGTFCLGVIQGLARYKLLDKFHYLSTVSGGGYIGGWLSAWINRHPRGLQGVSEDINHVRPKSKIVPDAEPVQYLRDYGAFVTPKLSLLSADVWSFVSIYLRNLMLNWLVIIPLMLAALALPRLNLSLIREEPWGITNAIIFVLALLLAGYSVGYMGINRPSANDALQRSKFWSKRTDQMSFLKWCLLPFTLSVLLFSLNWAWVNNSADAAGRMGFLLSDRGRSLAFFVLAGLVIHFIGWAFMSLALRRARASELAAVLVTGPVGGLLTWVVVAGAFSGPMGSAVTNGGYEIDPTTGLYASLAIPLFMIAMFLAVTLFVGLTSRRPWERLPRRDRKSSGGRVGSVAVLEDEDREWLARYSAWTLIVAILWAVASLLVVFGPLALFLSPKLAASIGGASGLTALLLGKSSKTGGGEKQETQKSALSQLMDQSLSVIAVIFLAILIAGLSFVTSLVIRKVGDVGAVRTIASTEFINRISTVTKHGAFVEKLPKDYVYDPANPSILAPVLGDQHGDLNLMKIMYYPPYWFIGGLAVLLFIFGMIVSRLINLNKFSLHAGYRNRIIRAFLGASRTSAERRPNLFTGFDPSDNIQMHELRPGLLRERSFKDQGLAKLVARLRDAGDDEKSVKTDVAAYLKSKLSDDTIKKLKDYTGSNEPSPSLRHSLIEDLNHLLEEDNFYGQPAFMQLNASGRTESLIREFSLSERNEEVGQEIMSLPATEQKSRMVKEFAHQYLRGDYLIVLNRLLLDQAFPDEFADWKYPLPPYRLMHVVNTALNLVRGENLAWQQRKAEAFSVSPLHCGSFFVGYRRSRDYGGDDGISLGTAVAISGAAVSSNMGYHSSSAAITFVLTFFNARLGWWLGNPGPAGDEYYDKAHPKQAIYPLLAEAFGLTDDKNSYVLLSDGGHFENLGIYEMVMRRTHFIVLADSGADPKVTFEDLGNAVRKIRIDMGIEIEFDQIRIFRKNDPSNPNGLYCAIGRIHYNRVDGADAPDGVLVYIKPAYYGTEPRDVFNYGQSNEEFPHESTADQFFDEPQFESHRMLGAYIINLMVGEDWEGGSLADFRSRIETHYINPS